MKIQAMASQALCFALGLLLGWILWHSDPVRESPAPERALPSGGIIVRRDPDAAVPAPVKQAAKESGGKLERVVSVTVQPRPIPVQLPIDADSVELAIHSPDAGKMVCSCAPFTVDLGLVRMPDRTHRVVATSADGEIIGGVDIPLDSAALSKRLRWAAGASFDPVRREFGAFLDRDAGPLRIGVELQNRRNGVAAVLRAGIRF